MTSIIATTDIIINKDLKTNEQSISCSSSTFYSSSAATKDSLINKLKIKGSKADINDWIDYWYYIIGVNVLPAIFQQKKPAVGWQEWQDKPILETQLNMWKKQNMFKGIIIIPGKVWRGNNQGKYFIHIDCDKKEAIDAFCNINGKTIPLELLAEKFIVEQHKDDTQRAHLMFYSPSPFPNKGSDGVTGIEVKGEGKHGLACCTPSIHIKGCKYEIIGTLNPITLSENLASELKQHIKNICNAHGKSYFEHKNNALPENIKKSLQKLQIDNDISIVEGTRHLTMLSIANSLLIIHIGKKDITNLKTFYDNINNINCNPLLKDSEISSIWQDAIKYVENNVKTDNLSLSDSSFNGRGSKKGGGGDDGGNGGEERGGREKKTKMF